MIRTVLFAAYMGLFFLTTPLTFIPYWILRMSGKRQAARKYIGKAARLYARHVIWCAGGHIEVTGLENLPEEKNICFVSNHQSLMDIPVIIAGIPVSAGFIAKRELASIPLLRMWMKALNCVMINRHDLRAALDVITTGAAYIEGGQPMIIFPEGTRSRTGSIGEFKPGSVKLATRAKAIIVPLTIQGAFGLFEETKRIVPSRIILVIHRPVETASLDREQQKALPQLIEQTIRSGFPAGN